MSKGGATPTGVGPRTADVLAYLAGVSVRTAPYALCVTAITAPKDTVQRPTALEWQQSRVVHGSDACVARRPPPS